MSLQLLAINIPQFWQLERPTTDTKVIPSAHILPTDDLPSQCCTVVPPGVHLSLDFQAKRKKLDLACGCAER